MQSETKAELPKQVDASDVKKRLDSVFGSYNKFSELIVKPGFNSPAIYGVLPIPMSPMIDNCSTPMLSAGKSGHQFSYSEPRAPKNFDQPSSSSSYSSRPQTKDVLQSMQSLVAEEPLSKLDCSTNRNCVVKDPAKTVPQVSNGVVEKESRKRALPLEESVAEALKKPKREAEADGSVTRGDITPPKIAHSLKEIPEESRREADLFGDLFGEEEEEEEALAVQALAKLPTAAENKNGSHSSPRIVLKLPRPGSSSSLSESKKDSKSKHKKHKSERAERRSEKKEKRQREVESSVVSDGGSSQARPEEKVAAVPENQEWEKREAESRCSMADAEQIDVEQILEHFGRVSPLLSPLHQIRISPPTKLEEDEDFGNVSTSNPHSINRQSPKSCSLNLNHLSPTKSQRLVGKWQKLVNGEHSQEAPSSKVCSEEVIDPEVPSTSSKHEMKSSVEKQEIRGEPMADTTRAEAKEASKESRKKRKEERRNEEKEKSSKFRHPEKSAPVPPMLPAILDQSEKVQRLPKPEKPLVVKKEPFSNVKQEQSQSSAEKTNWMAASDTSNIRIQRDTSPPATTIKQEPLQPPRPAKGVDCTERSKSTSKAVLENTDPSNQTVAHYQKLAKTIKRSGDSERDRIKKAIYYLESVVYFCMSASVHKATESGNSEYNIVAEVASFLKETTAIFTESKTESAHLNHFRARVRSISSVVQACLTYRLFQIRSLQAQKNYKILSQYERDPNSAHQQMHKKTATNGGDSAGAYSNNTMTPSPASSTPSSNRSNSSKETVAVPSDVYNVLFNQNKILNHLMWAHKIWADAFSQMSPANKAFMLHLDKICGEIKLESELRDVAIWLLTSVKWMVKEYEEMLLNSVVQ